eukprot:gene8016-biopygen8511
MRLDCTVVRLELNASRFQASGLCGQSSSDFQSTVAGGYQHFQRAGFFYRVAGCSPPTSSPTEQKGTWR